MIERFCTGLAGETVPYTCNIYQSDFPKITIYTLMDEFGNPLQSDIELQKEADKIAELLNIIQLIKED